MTWPRAAQPTSRRQPLTRELIVDAALKVLGRGNLESLSMRRVAQVLDTGAASLYAHVGNKEELHELMLDRLLGTIPLPEPDPSRWQEQLREVCRAQLAVLTRYPGIARVGMETTVPTGPNALRHGETMLALLRAGGLSDRSAALAFDTLSLWGAAFAVEVGAAEASDVDRRSAEIGAFMAEHAEQYPNLLRVGPVLGTTPTEERFEFGLTIFLASLPHLPDGS